MGDKLLQASCEQEALSFVQLENGKFELDYLSGNKPTKLLGEETNDERSRSFILRRASLMYEVCKTSESCSDNVKEAISLVEEGCGDSAIFLNLHMFWLIGDEFFKSGFLGNGVMCSSSGVRWMIYDSIFSPLHDRKVLSDDQIGKKSDLLQIYIYRM